MSGYDHALPFEQMLGAVIAETRRAAGLSQEALAYACKLHPTYISQPPMPIYVEILIRGTMDELWERTQDPAQHQRWDLRFTEIDYLPRESDHEPQRFRYATRIGLGMRIAGEGETTGTRDGPRGERTSALRFRSGDPRSLIREGSGYWQYEPTTEGVRFATGYDYRTRHGPLGAALDRLLFRPLMGWATAWSFDRLRLWIERGTDPRDALERSLVHAVARVSLAIVFLYHGIVPKLLRPHPDEFAMLADGGVPPSHAGTVLAAIGVAEVAWALLLLALWRVRWPFLATAAAMVLALGAVAVNSPRYLAAAFNPLTLNLAVAALAVVGWIAARELPTAARCRRTRAREDS